jgi:hypothetical protein
MLPRDPIESLREAVLAFISGDGTEGDPPQFDASFAPHIGWRPHILEGSPQRAWYLQPQPLENRDWLHRLKEGRRYSETLDLVVCAPETVLYDEPTLLHLDRSQVQVLRSEISENGAKVVGEVSTVCDMIYEQSLLLGIETARTLLNRALDRARTETDHNRRGVLLEVLSAVMFSQARGLRVKDVGVSRRAQQIDVTILNHNVGNPLLQSSPLIIAEAKNWRSPVGSEQYGWLHRKLLTSRGRAKLGFLITSGRFTDGVYTEAIRDSREDHMIVLLDGESLPAVWNNYEDITEGLEAAVYQAIMDHT